MTEPTELLPCPFCESQPTVHNDTDGPFWVVACGNLECAAQPETSGKTEADAIAAWNHRATQPTQAQAGAVPLTDKRMAKRTVTYVCPVCCASLERKE